MWGFVHWPCVAEKMINVTAAGLEGVQVLKPECFPKPIALFEIEKAADRTLYMFLYF